MIHFAKSTVGNVTVRNNSTACTIEIIIKNTHPMDNDGFRTLSLSYDEWDSLKTIFEGDKPLYEQNKKPSIPQNVFHSQEESEEFIYKTVMFLGSMSYFNGLNDDEVIDDLIKRINQKYNVNFRYEKSIDLNGVTYNIIKE